MPWRSTLKTTISLGSCPIALLSIRNICIASTPAIASKMPYFVTLVTFLGARAIVVKMTLGAFGQRSPIRLPFACPHIVDLGDILPLEGLCGVSDPSTWYISGLALGNVQCMLEHRSP
ncbi:hypothetical protein Tco_0259376 [Tanacetum coccineum]